MTDDPVTPSEPAEPAADRAVVLSSLVEKLSTLGATQQQIDAAVADNTLPDLVRSLALWGQMPDTTLADLARELDVSVDALGKVARAAGLPYDIDAREFVAADAAMFTSFVAGAQLFEPKLLLRYSRLLGGAAAKVAEASVSMFLRSRSEEQPEPGSAESIAWEGRALSAVRVFADTVPQTFERMLLHHFVMAAERFATTSGSLHTIEAAVGFVDLTDSTGLSLAMGARVIEPALAAFEMAAGDAASSRGGRLVKLIGDAAMFIVPDAVDAVGATRDIVAAVGSDERLRGARGGVAFGELLHRDGDYFGDPVNLAARLADAAKTGHVLVDSAVADRLGIGAIPDGTRRLEGFTDPVPVFLAR